MIYSNSEGKIAVRKVSANGTVTDKIIYEIKDSQNKAIKRVSASGDGVYFAAFC